MEIVRIRNQKEFQNFFHKSGKPELQVKFELGTRQLWKDQDDGHFEALCAACDEPVDLQVDKLYGSVDSDDGWVPNWRERLICPSCGLNNRQRAMVHALKSALSVREGDEETASLYAMEQVTPFYKWVEKYLPVDCTGSEYLFDDHDAEADEQERSREDMPGIRHENVEALSFENDFFDYIVSNDVFEHVNEPMKALSESFRVLKPRGEFFISVPFFALEASSKRRAELIDGEIKHYLPEQYHGNPVSDEGSLVFWDFGWDFLKWLKKAGFRKPEMHIYWSSEYGYLGTEGGLQYYFHAVKPRPGLLIKALRAVRSLFN